MQPIQLCATTIVTQIFDNYTLQHSLKFDHKTGRRENFLVQLQIKATQAYPDTVFAPFRPSNPPNDQAETTEEEVGITEVITQTTIEVTTITTETTTTHNYNSHLMMDILKRPVTRKMYVTTVDTQTTTLKIVINVNQRREISKFHTKQRQKTSRATSVWRKPGKIDTKRG